MTELIDIEIRPQGVSERLDPSGAIGFFTTERNWYQKYQQLLSENLVVSNQNLGDPGLWRTAANTLNNLVESLKRGDQGALRDYLKHARAFRCVVGQGIIGKQIDVFHSEGDPAAAKWTFYIFSSQWMTQGNSAPHLAPYRASLLSSPMFASSVDVLSASKALDDLEGLRASTKKSCVDITKFIDDKSKLISELERFTD